MAKFTNYARGPRGISLKDGTTVWLDPGESKTIDKGDVVEPLPDLGNKATAEPADDADLAALKAQVATLTKQVEDETAAHAETTKKLDEATKANATLTKQVEDLSKAAEKKS